MRDAAIERLHTWRHVALGSALLLILGARELAAQRPSAFWSFDEDFRATAGGAAFDLVPFGAPEIDGASARRGSGALRIEEGHGYAAYDSLEPDDARTACVLYGDTSSGRLLQTHSFVFDGRGALRLQRTTGSPSTAAFVGGTFTTQPLEISGLVVGAPLPVTVATLRLRDLRFELRSQSFAVQSNGSFTAQVELVPLGGTVIVTPNQGAEFRLDCATHRVPSVAALHGVLSIASGLLNLQAQLAQTLVLDDGAGRRVELTLGGVLTASQLLVAPEPTYLDLQARLVRPGQASFSVVAWYRYADLDGLGSDSINTICAARDSFRIALEDARSALRGRFFGSGLSGSSALVGDPTPDDGAWHHVALVYDRAAGELELYVDGALRRRRTLGPSAVGGGLGFRVGFDPEGPGASFDGWIDDLAIYDAALDASAIAALAASDTSPLALPFGRACGGLVAGTSGLPRLGETIAPTCRHATPFATALLALGVERSSWLGLELPFDLGLIGATGCELLISIDVPSTYAADAQGLLRAPFPLPLDEALVGVELATQWLVLAPGVNPLGLASSQGTLMIIER